MYEKNHDFKSADKAFKEGFDSRVNNLELLEKKYKSFEERMEARIARELNSSEINAETIKKHLQNELNKNSQKISSSINNLSIGSKRNHFELNYNNHFLYNDNSKMNEFVNKEIQSNFNFTRMNNASPFHKVKEPSLNMINDRSFNHPAKNQKVEMIKEIIEDPYLPLNSYTFYGQIPIYVDVQNRDKIITKAGKLVEIHKIISNYLLINDEKYKILNSEFEAKIKDEMMKKPYSLLQIDRNIIDKAQKISLCSLNEILINVNEAKKNLNILEAENAKHRPREERDFKADAIKSKENIVKINFQENDKTNFQNKIIESSNLLKNEIVDNNSASKYPINKPNKKVKLRPIEKDIYNDKTNIDLIINDLIKIPKNKEKIIEEKHSRETEKREAPQNLSI